MRNGNLGQAKANKNDEFYTMYGDIEKEISKYPSDFFRGKIVYSNCDDPYVSGFADYFFKNFFRLKIKKYIVTGINPTGLTSLVYYGIITHCKINKGVIGFE